ncbi:MAG: YARHG domain-containing protein [Treponema sp.]|jgi:hypothetical protein|nr:YARHG domain-containing protein [Treponema sp.]
MTFTEAINTGNISRINEIFEDPYNHYYWDRWERGFFIFNKTELWLLRNTIYAKYGYKFNNPYLKEHFSRFSWYNGVKTNVETELTDIEREYVSIIQRIEANYPSAVNEISGYWMDLPDGKWWEIDPREYHDGRRHTIDLHIYPNGTFYFNYIKREPMNDGWIAVSTFGYTGLWSFKNNEFCVSYIYEPELQPSPIIKFEKNLIINNNNGYLECNFLGNKIFLKRVDTDPKVRYEK